MNDLTVHLTGADILRDGLTEHSDISILGGTFTDAPCGVEIDLTGYLLMPGIIDLHGDAFERHLAPRPSAPFAPEIGLRSTERELLSNGVTAAYLAQSWSWEGGFRSPSAAVNLMKVIDAYRPYMIADMRVQVRFEYYLTDDGDALLNAAQLYGVDYIVFNNHLDQGIEMVETKPQALANWAAQNKRTIEQHLELMFVAKATEPKVPDFILQLGSEFARLGIDSGSHDDETVETRNLFNGAGAKICEFPLNIETAAHARSLGNPILMGAPNVVRGGSQSGNIAATDLIREGLCDVLVSDYYAPALATAAWTLVNQRILNLPQAWKMVSSNAADAKGWTDRGWIASGQRADAVIINKETRQIEGTIAGGQIGYANGGFATRLLSGQMPRKIVAA
ncbi:MAG: alpha-D-ribose 1-methylphosphonate 5-triphosphate diphosphatase [Pseudomonadota bacterium]